MNMISVVGLAAAFCTTVAYLPQALRIWRTRSAQDVSLGRYLVMSLGLVLWLVYGVCIGSLPIILANTATLLLTSLILILKLRRK